MAATVSPNQLLETTPPKLTTTGPTGALQPTLVLANTPPGAGAGTSAPPSTPPASKGVFAAIGGWLDRQDPITQTALLGAVYTLSGLTITLLWNRFVIHKKA